MKLYPIPPNRANDAWIQPFSIRSFVAQVSEQLGGCEYRPSFNGYMMDEPTFNDLCADPDSGGWGNGRRCHVVAGFTLGQTSCPLWEGLLQLCQTEGERRFLHWYLNLAKDRQFPMLIPQARIGIAERRRPDFALYVPLQYWKYNWYAIELDAAHSDDQAEMDELRNAEISVHGYQVISLRPTQKGYYDEVKTLVERIEHEMNQADSDIWRCARGVRVESVSEDSDDVPF